MASQDIDIPLIRDIMTGDLDRDTFRDIAIVGSDEVQINGYWYPSYGWFRVLENNKTTDGEHADNAYREYYNSLTQDVAYAIDIADQDYDNVTEAFVGTGAGVEIYESTAGDFLSYLQFIPTPSATKALRVGNTDGDSWFEIVAGSGKRLIVFEQNQTELRSDHIYDAVWMSPILAEEITAIRLGDTNLNNRTEIIATAAKGYLYDFEWLSLSLEPNGGLPLLASSQDSLPVLGENDSQASLTALDSWRMQRQTFAQLNYLRRVDT
jgi:hypothetical protein